MRNHHQFLSVQKLFYIFLLIVLPACAESNSSVSANSSGVSNGASSSTSKKEQSDFEAMLKGFPECKFEGPYFELNTYKPLNKYLSERKLMPYEIDSGVSALYYVDESFYGMKVSELIIDIDNQKIVGIYINDKVENVIANLKNYLRHGFNKPIDDGTAVPYLKSHDLDKSKTFMFCPDGIH